MSPGSTNNLPKVCVIGAGSSGIAASKQLHQHGIPFDTYEKASSVGGLWNFGHDAGHNAAYRSLHINTSKQIMEFSDYPMPADYPDYPGHEEIADYFADYIDHFGFGDKIHLNTAVEHAVRRDDGVWEITLGDGRTLEYDALIVANGHHWDPRWPEPEFPGQFDGQRDALARLRRPEAVHRQERRRARNGQQRDGHRRRDQHGRRRTCTWRRAAAFT